MSGSTASRGYQYPEDGDFQSEFPAISRQAMERVDVDMASALSGVSGVSTRVSALEARPPSVRYDTTAGVAVYVHDGTTERLVSYDSGWRNIWSLVDPQVLVPAATQPRMMIRRTERTVELVVRALPGPLMVGDSRSRTRNFITALPQGFRNFPLIGGTVGTSYITDSPGIQIDITNGSGSGYLGIRAASGTWSAGDSINCTIQFPCDEGIPTTLPGTPE